MDCKASCTRSRAETGRGHGATWQGVGSIAREEEKKMRNIWEALMFMSLGGVIVEVFNWRSWRMYHAGKREGRAERDR